MPSDQEELQEHLQSFYSKAELAEILSKLVLKHYLGKDDLQNMLFY